MIINKGTLAKEVDGEIHLIYPKTSSDMVDYDSDQTVKEKIATMEHDIHSEIDNVKDALILTPQIYNLNDFVKKNNIVQMGNFEANDSATNLMVSCSNDGINPGRSIINGSFYPSETHMRMSEPLTLESGKTYSVYVCSDEKDINFTFYLYATSSDSTYQENGVDKSIGKTLFDPFTILKPETTDEYYVACYLDFERTFTNDNLYVYIIEGEYTFDDFMYIKKQRMR